MGLAWAVAILGGWLVTLPLSLLLPTASEGATALALITAAVLLRAFLQTGLFIVAHDAMHGSLCPQAPRWNDRIGRLSLTLYGWLPWHSCRRNHRRHHRAPASPGDPDHHDGDHRHPVAWYFHFLASYLSALQMTALLGSWLVVLITLASLRGQALERLLLFWTLPLLLSSLQLFIVGTYLPHRHQTTLVHDRHQAVSLRWPRLISFLACFHFGYHWEHHAHPQLPWYCLPESRQKISDPGDGTRALAVIKRSR